MVKWWDTELCNRVVGPLPPAVRAGYGYMTEYPVGPGRFGGQPGPDDLRRDHRDSWKEIIGPGTWGV